MNEPRFQYFPASYTAGYSGFVVYYCGGLECNVSYWMIPGTWEHDWDNR